MQDSADIGGGPDGAFPSPDLASPPQLGAGPPPSLIPDLPPVVPARPEADIGEIAANMLQCFLGDGDSDDRVPEQLIHCLHVCHFFETR